ncbi:MULTISPECIES: alpha/beta hydrolase [Bradyrhizobium]|uniref:Alpha/beta hydrolase n=1 Tax=Bradyrhizobium elkanii TaxID=29448 RepID=A0A4U6SB10_BRAEL|nr:MULTISPECIES: alpha/beta hydrolase [Bradyrhizobium]MTV16202.1 alpha/beta hydrolase [Bradyrhizobium sp. BR2003]TKV81926.1 alpha/beta hydrolase [Bradyrhizobium elkanii]
MATPQPSHAPTEPFRLTSSDGLSLACARWDSDGPARGLVQIAHGMGEHIGRYTSTIDVLVSAGLTVYAGDHRGHGLTARSRSHLGEFGEGGFELLVQDMLRLSELARDENPDLPLILLGHSMGSFAAQRYVIDYSHEIDGLVLSGSGSLDGLARAALQASPGSNLLNAAFEPARTPFDWLSRDHAVVNAFMADPLCFAALGPEALASFLGTAPRLSNLVALRKIRSDLPIYLFSGSEDPVGQQLRGVHAVIDRYHRAGLHDIAFDFYPGGRHEMLNEINRRDVQTRLLGWISQLLEKLDGGRGHVSPAYELQR